MINDLRLSIIVPVYNDPDNLRECIAGLQATVPASAEIIVVDDASTDVASIDAATQYVTLLRLKRNSGPAAARNHGARHAIGEVLWFVDADVVVAPNAVTSLFAAFAQRTDVAAVFGSYDAHPRAAGLVSQYRNLLHHFVHQHGNSDASTFWAGCGAVQRAAFFAVGGFDELQFPRSSIEDIDLGYRLRQSGYRIFLDKSLQCTHLKRWTLRSMIWTDIVHRAIPWSQLLLTRKYPRNDLNLVVGQQFSVVLVGLAMIAVLGAVLQPQSFALAFVALVVVGIINRDLYAFFHQRHGLSFACLCMPLHLLYYVCSGVSYGYAWWTVRIRAKTVSRVPNLERRNS